MTIAAHGFTPRQVCSFMIEPRSAGALNEASNQCSWIRQHLMSFTWLLGCKMITNSSVVIKHLHHSSKLIQVPLHKGDVSWGFPRLLSAQISFDCSYELFCGLPLLVADFLLCRHEESLHNWNQSFILRCLCEIR